MAFALKSDAGWTALVPGQSITSGGIQFSWDSMLLWSDDERAAYGIAAIVEPDAVPAGKTVTATAIVDVDGVPHRQQTLADIPLADAQAASLVVLRAACDAEIVAGYASSALGAPHTYPSTATDQANMQASVVASLMPDLAAGWTTPFWVEDAAGAWAMAPHTAAQIQQAGKDIMAGILATRVKLATLEAEVAAATDFAGVQIAWY